jgi:hypothetical protein
MPASCISPSFRAAAAWQARLCVCQARGRIVFKFIYVNSQKY